MRLRPSGPRVLQGPCQFHDQTSSNGNQEKRRDDKVLNVNDIAFENVCGCEQGFFEDTVQFRHA